MFDSLLKGCGGGGAGGSGETGLGTGFVGWMDFFWTTTTFIHLN